jgi:hypothetical protein
VIDVCDVSVKATVRGVDPDVGIYVKLATGYDGDVTLTHDNAVDAPNVFAMVSLIDQLPTPNVFEGDATPLQNTCVPFPPVLDEFVYDQLYEVCAMLPTEVFRNLIERGAYPNVLFVVNKAKGFEIISRSGTIVPLIA